MMTMPKIRRRPARRNVLAFVALLTTSVLLVGACSGSGDDPGESPSTDAGQVSPPASSGGISPPASAVGPGLSVSDALKSELDLPLLVNGFLISDGATTKLCEAMLESYPPQCGGPFLLVENVDLASFPNMRTEGSVSWIDDFVQLLGPVDDGVLRVASNVIAGGAPPPSGEN